MLKTIAVALVATTLIAAPVLAAGQDANPANPAPAATGAPADGGKAAAGDTAKAGAPKIKTAHRHGTTRHVVQDSKGMRHYAKHPHERKVATRPSKHRIATAKPHKLRVSQHAVPQTTSPTRSGT